MVIGMVALWAVLIWGAFYVATRVTQKDATHPRSTLDLLQDRFARGEIDQDELESRRRALEGS